MTKKKTPYMRVDYGKLEIQVAATQTLPRELKGSKMSLGKLLGYKGKAVSRKQYVESEYPGRDGFAPDVEVWNIREKGGEKIITWYCSKCAVEVPKDERCKYCGKTKREKS